MSQGTTPPGWYDDGNGSQRWWDGTSWTEHTQPPLGPPPAAPPVQSGGWQQPTQQIQSVYPGSAAYGGPTGAPGRTGGHRTGLLIALAAVVAVVLLAGSVVLGLVLARGGDSADSATRVASAAPASPPPSSGASLPTAPTAPSTVAPSTPSDLDQLTCGEVRTLTTRQLVGLLDRAARVEVDRSGNQDARDFLDLPFSQQRRFVTLLSAACVSQSDATKLKNLDDFD